MTLSDEAETIWQVFFDQVEKKCGDGGELRPLKDFAAKAAEHAARIAGVLTIIEDHRASHVAAGTMTNAVKLTDWYVGEAIRLHDAGRLDPRLVQGQQLLDWLRKREATEISFRDILQNGPAAVRRKADAEAVLKILKEHGWIAEVKGRPRGVRVLPAGDTG